MSEENIPAVLCVPSSKMTYACQLAGGCMHASYAVLPVLYEDASFVAREWAERPDDHRFLQVIPYVVFAVQGENGRSSRVLSYSRVKGGGEARLLGKKSIGFGGHVDLADMYLHGTNYAAAIMATVQRTIQREIREELGEDEVEAMSGSGNCNFVGLIYSRNTAVGSVHLGLLHKVDLPDDSLVAESLHETVGHTRPVWTSLDSVLENADEYEEWSVAVANMVTKLGWNCE